MSLPLQASQEFIPQGRQVINRGALLGSLAEVTAQGTYQLAEQVQESLSDFFHIACCILEIGPYGRQHSANLAAACYATSKLLSLLMRMLASWRTLTNHPARLLLFMCHGPSKLIPNLQNAASLAMLHWELSKCRLRCDAGGSHNASSQNRSQCGRWQPVSFWAQHPFADQRIGPGRSSVSRPGHPHLSQSGPGQHCSTATVSCSTVRDLSRPYLQESKPR